MNFVDIQVEMASFLNPLSNLPGNRLIEKKLNEVLNLETYSVIYFDLDHFKAYNDLYGFNKGDKVLLHLTQILTKNIQELGYFLGHIGGDDFMAVLPHYEIETICTQIIKDFDQTILDFYESKHIQNHNFQVKGRSGNMEPFTFISLSIAVLTNKNKQFHKVEDISNAVASIKRKCKQINKSCYCIC